MDLINGVYRWLQHAKDFALIKRADDNTGMRIDSDSDWAGLHNITGDTRSRSGSIFIHNGMVFAWSSTFQSCKSTGFIPGMDDIALSSGEGELYALCDTLKGALSNSHFIDEFGSTVALPIIINQTKPILINTDSAAAQGFAQGHGKTGRMRHIDVRADWVKQLRDRSVCKIVKIPGVDNIADGLTKILSRPAFQEWEQKVMQRIFEPSIGK